MEWSGYEPSPYQHPFKIRDLPRREARALYNQLMMQRFSRINRLRDLLQLNGVEINDNDDESVQLIDEWFLTELRPAADDPSNIDGAWGSVTDDIALYLGEAAIKRYDVHWEFFLKGARAVGYQRPVLVGFKDTPSAFYEDPLLTMTFHALTTLRAVHMPQPAMLHWLRNLAARPDDPI